MNVPNDKPMKTPAESEVFTTELVMPNDINPYGTLFGGALMAWIDKTAAMAAQRHSGGIAVTASVDHLTFRAPAHVGDQIIVGALVNWAGNSSMEVGVKAQRVNAETGETTHLTTAYLTFVAIETSWDGEVVKREIPGINPQTKDDLRRYQEAEARRDLRLKHKEFFDKK